MLTDLLRETIRNSGDENLTDNFRTAISQQFDLTMERASGWFKRRVQLVTFGVAALLVGLNNVDTVAITTALSTNPETRAELVKLAVERTQVAPENQSVAEPPTMATADASKDKQDTAADGQEGGNCGG